MSETTRPNIFPALRYRDAPAAIAWLKNACGFGEQLVVPGEEEGSVAHAQLTFGPGAIMLGSRAEPSDENPWADATHGIYVYVEDVDAHHAQAVAAGAEIASALRDTEYGSREYTLRDPEGNLWSFGTYLP